MSVSTEIPGVVVVVPTLNPGATWTDWIAAFCSQVPQFHCMVIDSSSADDTVDRARDSGFQVEVVDRLKFDHGETRNLGLDLTRSGIIVYMTQDAILDDSQSIAKLVSVFEQPDIAAVYGRQLARASAEPFEAFLRIRNYPDESYVCRYDDRHRYGLRTAFMSNSFAAYRRDALESIGGFQANQIFGEDMAAAARMLQHGWKIAYSADARVVHSHAYTTIQEFRRYFDMGVFHAREPWIREDFGGAEGEGVKFVISEFKYLLRYAFWRVPEGLLRTVFRYAGFRLGLMEKLLPVFLKRKLSMNQGYFK